MNGIIIIDKPKGQTSHDIVYKIKKYTGEKIGHTGTLDPMASGVLPILIGTATKISKYLIEHDKTYEVILKLGEKTTTADAEGTVIETKTVPPLQLQHIESILQNRIGKQTQTPPIYSAIKVNGQKLYEYARKEQKVVIPKRQIEIYKATLQAYTPNRQEIAFTVSCSKGTYIRSLCETIAEDLQTVGYMKELRRTQVGKFTLENAIPIDQLETLPQHIYTIETLFQTYPSYTLSPSQITPFLNGVKLPLHHPDTIMRIYKENGDFIGLGMVQNHQLKRDVIL